jgi:hypothetical protein
MSAAEAAPDQPTEPRSTHDSNNLKLRVTYLHAGNPRPPHELGQISADTTVGELKSRLQSELLEGPRPEEQRLIYQGRPLLQDAVTLREALRLNGPIGPLPYTIHIIIQPRHASSHFRPEQTADGHAATTVDGAQPGVAAAMPSAIGQGAMNPEQMTAQMHAMAQAHMNMLHQQIHNLQHQQHVLGAQPHVGASIHVNGQQVYPPPQPNAGGHPAPTPTPTTNASDRQTHPPAGPHAGPPQMQAFPGPILLNPGQQFGNAPFQRPLSVPPPIRQGVAPNPPLLHNHAPGFMPLPAVVGPMAHLAGQRTVPSQPTEPTVWLTSSRNGPEALLFAPGHGYFSSGGAVSALAHRNNVLLPQLQAQTNPLRSSIVPAPSQNDNTAPRPAHQAQDHPQQQPMGPAAGPLALQRQLQPGPLPAAPRRPRALQDDFMGLVIQRGWLFLRLYMFTFVLSEPGTWRRYLLLGLALIVCLLPRQNPLSDLMVAARRHVDNLIGPPAPQRPAPAQTGVQPAAAPAGGAPRPPPVRGAVNITPEQAATRILNEQQQQRDAENNNQPPNFLRDTFYRAEQAVALFLASLVPGVGERHVAAREEQRRERLRLEMERANAERAAAEAEEERMRNEAAGGEQPTNAEHPQAASTSSGVELAGTGEQQQMRERVSAVGSGGGFDATG